ncbi:MAG: hypothetical protein DCC49_02795 [Acidobacteria bacterium]|nr:MAG: hypothetical protein DCC49_02795 [Acidobacteriota bacterium]
MANNPAWTRDELILGLRLYLDEGQLRRDSDLVKDLSATLRGMADVENVANPDSFRSPSAVAKKLANFAALDPLYAGKGLVRGSHGDREVWDEYAADPDNLDLAADAIAHGELLPVEVRADDLEPPEFTKTIIEIERRVAEEFRYLPKRIERIAKRRESDLVESFATHLLHLGHTIERHMYARGRARLFCDLFDETSQTLYEAKGHVRRVAIRMAVGQLYDYARLESMDTEKSVLLPIRPKSDLRELLKFAEISVVWPDEGTFLVEHTSGDVAEVT